MTSSAMFIGLQKLVARASNSRIGRELAGSLGLKIASAGLTFLVTVILARTLGPADYGVYAYIYALVSLLSVPSEFGLPQLVVRETARGVSRGDYSAVQGIWRWSAKITAIVSLTLVVLTAIGLWLFKEPLSGKRLETLVWALALVPLISLGNLRGAALVGLHKVVAGQLPEFLIRPGLLALFLIVVALLEGPSFTAPHAMALYVAAAGLAFWAGAWLLWRAAPIEVRRAEPRMDGRTWFLSTLPLAFIGGMQLINQQASILIQGFFLPDDQIGLFRVAAQVSALASFGLYAVNMVLSPRFAVLYAQGNKARLQRLVTNSARLILVFNLLITAGFAVLGKQFLRIAFGATYVVAYLPIMILLGGQAINSATGSVGSLLNMSGFERETARGRTFAAVLNIALNLLLIPYWGVIGAAIATAAALITWNVLLWWAVRKRLGINSLAFTIVKVE
ncbi:MAG: oligosaccharide flippase family protein [Chloroflexi bacterium]|nr:oligosaccharide flippase family protein [Chloroflexota bacterium]